MADVETLIRSVVGRGVELVADFNRKRLPEPDAPHPFLSGIHRPMTGETTLVDLPVTGAIPAGLDGRYLRIGPNPVAADPRAHHWFTGDGMIHGVALQGGRAVSYRNRWIRSRHVAAELGVAPAPGERHGGLDTVNTNVVAIGARTWALVEGGSYPVELDETLEEQTYNPFDGTLEGSFTAHPHRDPLTGEHHAICYEGADPNHVRHVVVDADARVIREEPIRVEHGPSIHDCAITARYAVILDLPVTFSMRSLIGGHPFPYQWNPRHRARVGLLPRAGTDADVIWCDVDPSYVFHVGNAFDAPDGTVVMDVCAYASMFDECLTGPKGRPLGLERWTIDPIARTVQRRPIDASPQEFPRPDERRIGRPYRYLYTMALPETEADAFIGANRLYKHDLEAGTRQVHDFGAGRYPGEFVFVPADEGADEDEDEGWLIGLVVDLAGETTDLVILDARAFADASVASVRIPHRIPPGFHGNWLPR